MKSDACAEWAAASSIDAHALFEMQPGATVATVLDQSLFMRDQTVLILQREVEATFAAQNEQQGKQTLLKRSEMWHDSPARVPRETVRSVVTLDYRNYTITIGAAAAVAEGAAEQQLRKQVSVAVVRQTVNTDSVVTVHCADCRTVALDGPRVELSGLTVDDGDAEEAWSQVLIAHSAQEAMDWKVAIASVCEQAKSLNVRFQRLRMVQSRKRHTVHERLILQRQLLDRASVWSQFEGLNVTSKNKLLRKLTKEPDKRVPGVVWVPEGTVQCAHPGCSTKFGIRLGIPHHMHHCRLCGIGVCGAHFVDAGARLPESMAHEGIPPETRTEPLDDQTTSLERALGRNRLELLNTEVDVYSESARCWVVGRITDVDRESGDVSVSYSGLPSPEAAGTAASDSGAGLSRLKTIKATAASSIRLHQVTPWSDLSVPVCITCKELLRTVDELPESEPQASKIQQIMSAMADDYRRIKTAGASAPSCAEELRKVWKGRVPHLESIGLKREALKFVVWLKNQATLSPDDVAWKTSMQEAGLLHSARAFDRLESVDMVKLARDNISDMLEQIPGVKALLVDETTNGILSASLTTTAVAEQGIVVGPQYLFSGSRVRHRHVRAIVWIRPTEQNIQQLCEELKNPSFAEYHIFFSSRDDHNISGFVERLAEADIFEIVRGVSECLGECVAISPEMFALEITVDSLALFLGPWYSTLKADLDELGVKKMEHLKDLAPQDTELLASKLEKLQQPTFRKKMAAFIIGEMSYSERVRRLNSVLLSLGRQPIIRYSKTSEQATAIAQKLSKSMAMGPSLDKVTAGGRRSVLLIVDRDDDPFTPLMNQWTFMAMQHELLLEPGSCGSSRLKFTVTDTGKMEEMPTLPPGGAVEFGSSFARRHMHNDWGAVCEGYERMKRQRIGLKREIAELNESSNMEDTKRAVSLIKERDDPNHLHDLKCVTLVQELETRANQQRAEDVSRFQVKIADCAADASSDPHHSHYYRDFEQHSQELVRILEALAAAATQIEADVSQATAGRNEVASEGVKLQRKRVILLFTLRYPLTPPDGGRAEAWLQLCTQEEKDLVRFIRLQAQRLTTWIPLRDCSAARRFYETRWSMDPILTYRPRLEWTLHRVLEKKQLEQQYAFSCEDDELRAQRQAFARPGQLDVIVFFVGGITCQEARIVHEFNEFNAEMAGGLQASSAAGGGGVGSKHGMRVICGGDFITSASRYCAALAQPAAEAAMVAADAASDAAADLAGA